MILVEPRIGAPMFSYSRKRNLMKKLIFLIIFMAAIFSFLSMNSNAKSKNSMKTVNYNVVATNSKILPNSRISNYTVGENGNIAIAFYSNDILIYNQEGKLINHIIIKDSEHFLIKYRDANEAIDIFVMRDNKGILMTEDGHIIEEYEFEYKKIEDTIKESKKRTKSINGYTYKMKSSYRFPITTCSTKLVQYNDSTGEQVVICDNKFVSIVESIGLILVIILFFTVIGVAGSKIIKFFLKMLLSSNHHK